MHREILAVADGGIDAVVEKFHRAYAEGVWERLAPGFSRLEGCTQGRFYHFEGDVLVHTALVFAHAAQHRELDPLRYQSLLEAALIHDIKKPDTRAEVVGHVSFYEHESKAAEVAPELSARAGLSAEQAKVVTWLVAEHMNAHVLPKRREHSRLQYYQMPDWPLLAALQACDALGNWLDPKGLTHAEVHTKFFIDDSARLFAKEERLNKERALKKRITAMLAAHRIEPGPLYGDIVKELVSLMGILDFSTDERLASAVQDRLTAQD